MITPEEAVGLANLWAGRLLPPAGARVSEFDQGWVVVPVSAEGEPRPVGEGYGVVDRRTGEVSVWASSLPSEDHVAAEYRRSGARTRGPRAWDPLRRARRDLRRTPYPATVSELTVAGRVWSARSAKGDGALAHHVIVSTFFDALPVEYRDRVGARASEAIVLSDALLAEDEGRRLAERPGLSVEEARDEYFSGASIVTALVREPGDQTDRRTRPPSVSSLLLLRFLGFGLADLGPAGVPPGEEPA